VLVKWEPPVGAVPTAYEVRRDGQLVKTVASPEGSFEDVGAAPGAVLGPPSSFEASKGTFPGFVRLTWQPAPVAEGTTSNYEVVALFGERRGASSAPVSGRRAAPVVTYEIARDGGPFTQAGLGPVFEDVLAPLGTTTGAAEITTRPEVSVSAVILAVSATTWKVTPAPPSSYRLQARWGDQVLAAATVDTGFRKFDSPPAYQWQRSLTDADVNYSDLPGATGAIWYDPLPPSDGTRRYYRVRLATAGVQSPTSAGVRAEAVATFKKLANGSANHGCAITSTDQLRCWGTDTAGCTLPPAGAFTDIAVGFGFSCGISDQKLRCFGQNTVGQAPPGPSVQTYRSVVAGDRFSCALRTDDRVDCFGLNDAGQAPPGPSPDTFKNISGTWQHVCGVRTDGSIRCWGRDNQGAMLGAPTSGTFKTVSAGTFVSCALDSNDRLRCWGYNNFGGAPIGPSIDTFSQVITGEQSSCARRSDGKTVCFGVDLYLNHNPPIEDGFAALSGGALTTCGLRADGRPRCWGAMQSGQAVLLPSDEQFTVVRSAGRSACALRKSDARAVCWGERFGKAGGMLGQSPVYMIWNQATAAPSEPLKLLVGGTNHYCGIRFDDVRVCWGQNDAGQAPLAGSVDKFRALAAGRRHTCGLLMDGRMTCLGDNTKGQAPPGPSVDSYTQLIAGVAHTCALRPDGKMVCFGDNGFGQAPPGPSTEAFVSLTGGRTHTCGLTAEGALHCVGRNSSGVAPPTPNASRFVEVSNPKYHGCGILTDLSAQCWGSTSRGRAPARPSFDTFQSIAAGGAFGCAVRTDGRLFCWGSSEGPRLVP